MSKSNPDNITIGKNGKAYYGKGTKGGLAPQSLPHNNDINKIHVNEQMETGIGAAVTGENGETEYVAFNNAYRITIEPRKWHILNDYTIENVEKQLQKVELALNDFKKAFKKFGYLDKEGSITTPKIDRGVPDLDFFVGDVVLLTFCLLKGEIESNHNYNFEGSYNSYHWEGRHMDSNSYTIDSHKTVISRLKGALERITKEITDQGFKIDNKHVETLIQLKLQKKTDLVGSIKYWIPYVCAGVSKEQLFEILKKENNPDYNNTGKIAASVETALKLNSIHPFFKELIT